VRGHHGGTPSASNPGNRIAAVHRRRGQREANPANNSWESDLFGSSSRCVPTCSTTPASRRYVWDFCRNKKDAEQKGKVQLINACICKIKRCARALGASGKRLAKATSADSREPSGHFEASKLAALDKNRTRIQNRRSSVLHQERKAARENVRQQKSLPAHGIRYRRSHSSEPLVFRSNVTDRAHRNACVLNAGKLTRRCRRSLTNCTATFRLLAPLAPFGEGLG